MGGLALDRVFRSGRNLTNSCDRDPLKSRNPHESRVEPPYCPHKTGAHEGARRPTALCVVAAGEARLPSAWTPLFQRLHPLTRFQPFQQLGESAFAQKLSPMNQRIEFWDSSGQYFKRDIGGLVAGARNRLYRPRCTLWRHDFARMCLGRNLQFQVRLALARIYVRKTSPTRRERRHHLGDAVRATR